ncbi:Hcp family type VI secretion system effector [Chitinimonas taiwanensis]|jgi:type VI secretion system secreted protein Hcp|uniref:Type VI secretion system secreted protein Hcp n=1 Tax=Chitinimonas taiwanensis DSM 18899 TaxID=1121279 RepID=A0A1K2HKV8_9NEIS|nr:type VI secretion system tube protein Hcp [Chitinimonas taiwanensis]SFZ77407.1 type VI secretion system secreted protein Hcp [Chitinimonas taiwanensis DSM 18899]
MKDIYVKFNGKFKIDGESNDSEHQKWLEVESWAHQIKQPKSATASSAGGHTAERCEHGDMQFQKFLDLTSPKLWEACSAGHTFDEVVIDFMRADGAKRVKYLEIKLKHVIVSSVSPDVSGEGVPSERFSLKYAAIQWTYVAQAIAGGQKGNSTGAWSLAKNTNQYTA